METPESSKRRRIDCSGGSLGTENVERNDGGVDSKHKVFLCHSGKQKDFVEWMHDEIKRHDLSVFFDKNRGSLPLGCHFPREIFKAIEECEVGVVVLSQAFFTKTWWPMQEFARLAKRKEANKDFVLILVYYNGLELAECKDKKKQMEWKEAWEKWAVLDNRIVIEDWTSVFRLFGPTMAISYNKEGGAKRLIGEVVARVCELVTPETRGDDLDMQGRERICELVWGKMQASGASCVDGPRVVGLFGMGGIGKSTMCRALCEKLRSYFGERVCHAELASNMDEEKEKELLGEMVKWLIGTADKVVAGYSKMKRLNLLMKRLREQKVFLIIDNVEDGARSKKLARDLLNATYAEDSFVVVTARTSEILQDVGISDGECHGMPELENEEAMRLLLNNARKGVHLNDALIKKCVGMCFFFKGEGRSQHYHPLALKVLGGQLGQKPEECMLRLEGCDPFNADREREHPIYGILRSSFDLLESEDQLLFMDVALFFPCQSRFPPYKDVNVMTWLRLVHGINEVDLTLRLNGLKRKSLIECIGDGRSVVGMHDLWREFCVNEARKDNARGQRWFYRVKERQDSFDECKFYGGGWENLQRVCLTTSDGTSINMKRVNLERCLNLTVLKLVNLHRENGVVDVRPLLQLKSLEVYWKYEFRGEGAGVHILGLGLLVDLSVLILVGLRDNSSCIGEVASLVWLEVLVLVSQGANELSMHAAEPIKDKLGLTRLPDLGNLCCLRFVRLKLGRLPSQQGWSNMKNLQYLYLGGNNGMLSCNGLEDLVALVELNLEECRDLKELPCLGKLKKLESLNISWSRVSEVPGLDCLVALQKFRAIWCRRLKRLPDLQRLSNLEVLDLEHSMIVEPICGLEGLTSLRFLCVHFDMVKDSSKQCPLTKVVDVEIESWGEQGLPCMVGWTSLKRLEIRYCCGVCKLEGLEILSNLQFLHIEECDFRDMSIVSCLASLQDLWIRDCNKLERVPSLVQLLKLETLQLSGLGVATWEVCGTLPQLHDLRIFEWSVISLPELGHFLELRRLYLGGCGSLTRLTSEGPLAMLEDLRIEGCGKLEFVPNFSGCTRLRYVYLRGCESLIPAPSFSGLERCCNDVRNGRDFSMEKGEYTWIKGPPVPSYNRRDLNLQ